MSNKLLGEYTVDLSGVKIAEDDPTFEEWLTSVPVIEKIVRCKDCKYVTEYNSYDCKTMLCYTCFYFDNEYSFSVEPNYYCSWGEREKEV